MPPLLDATLANFLAAVPPGPLVPGVAVTDGPRVTPEDLRYSIALRGYLTDPDLQVTSGPTRIWRIYLSARLDVCVDFTADDAIQVAIYQPQTPDGLPGAGGPVWAPVTLWLNTRAVSGRRGADVRPRRYFISRELRTSTGFVSGELLDDFMESHESRAAWPEQEYGSQGWPRTGAASGCH